MSESKYLTKEGLENLKKELHGLKTKGRPEAARAIAEAREKGDLSENAEYDAAKEAQGHLENKIAQLENIVANAKLIDMSTIDTSKVMIMTTVRVLNLKTKSELKYTLVGEQEADIKAGKISVSSPIGKGLLGRKKGEVADIVVPAGKIQLEILDISVSAN